MHKGKPIAFFSKSLGPKAAAYSTYDKEAMAILEVLKNGSITLLQHVSSLKHINKVSSTSMTRN